MQKNPLFLPVGSIRAILTLSTTIFIFIALYFKITLPEYIIITWNGILGFYFAGRMNFQKQKIDE